MKPLASNAKKIGAFSICFSTAVELHKRVLRVSEVKFYFILISSETLIGAPLIEDPTTPHSLKIGAAQNACVV